jgi:hypothetical protein
MCNRALHLSFEIDSTLEESSVQKDGLVSEGAMKTRYTEGDSNGIPGSPFLMGDFLGDLQNDSSRMGACKILNIMDLNGQGERI